MTWLARYTTPDSGRPLWEAVHAAPGGWACVTDGRCLLGAKRRADPARPPLLPVPGDKGKDVVARLLNAPVPDDAAGSTLADLWLWLDHVALLRCPACRPFERDARDPEVMFCSECDGRRWVFPVPDPADADTVRACGKPLDRNRLAWWLAGELGDIAPAVRVFPAAGLDAVTFDGGRWRLVVMALKADVHPGVYRAYTPGAGQWWHLRRDPVSRLVARDWCEERGLGVADLYGPTEDTHHG
jgi:hypothetical protein